MEAEEERVTVDQRGSEKGVDKVGGDMVGEVVEKNNLSQLAVSPVWVSSA